MIYTLWIDYFATGEGRTVFLNIVDANTKEQALASMSKHIGQQYADYYMVGVEYEEGFNPENRYVVECLSKTLIDKLEENKDRAMIDIYCEQYFNFA